MTNFLFVNEIRGPLCTGRPFLATIRRETRGGSESRSVAVCSMRTARFDEDIGIFLRLMHRRVATEEQGTST
jgi:hypothetical protein